MYNPKCLRDFEWLNKIYFNEDLNAFYKRQRLKLYPKALEILSIKARKIF